MSEHLWSVIYGINFDIVTSACWGLQNILITMLPSFFSWPNTCYENVHPFHITSGFSKGQTGVTEFSCSVCSFLAIRLFPFSCWIWIRSNLLQMCSCSEATVYSKLEQCTKQNSLCSQPKIYFFDGSIALVNCFKIRTVKESNSIHTESVLLVLQT